MFWFSYSCSHHSFHSVLFCYLSSLSCESNRETPDLYFHNIYFSEGMVLFWLKIAEKVNFTSSSLKGEKQRGYSVAPETVILPLHFFLRCGPYIAQSKNQGQLYCIVCIIYCIKHAKKLKLRYSLSHVRTR